MGCTSQLCMVTLLFMSGLAQTYADFPATFFPVQSGAVEVSLYSDGDATRIQLNHTFYYFKRQYSQLYLSMNGFLSFEYIVTDTYDPNLKKDIIAPLWVDIDTYNTGSIFHEQATSGPLINLATEQVNQMFPGLNFTASWVFVGTWVDVEFEFDPGNVTFQVVLVSDDEGRSFVLMNYGALPAYSNSWLAGYKTGDVVRKYVIQVPSTAYLSSTTNVGITGRWAFRVDGTPVPSTFYPILPDAVEIHLYNDGDAAPVQLNRTFNYFGRQFSQLYFSMNGFVSFQSISIDSYDSSLNRDIIAPLWADVDTYNKGRMFYSQVRSGPFISLATQQVNQMFPGQNFTASWVFVGTWVDVEFEYYAGDVNIQVVLISDNAGRTFALLNYGDLPAYSNPWMAGYKTLDNKYNFIIQVPGTTSLSSTSNVGTPGRWAFRVDGNAFPATFFPVQSGAVEVSLYSDGDATRIQLNHTFYYFKRQYSQLYLSMNGFLSFEYIVTDTYDPNLKKDIIAPLWVDIDTYNTGSIFYEQATSGPLINLATEQVNQMFPGLNFTASWVFVGTWVDVEFEFDPGNVTFQVVLVSDDEGRSFVLMNYGALPAYSNSWLAGYKTGDVVRKYVIQVPSTAYLSSTTNVGITGRWAFRVDGTPVPSTFYPILPDAVEIHLYSDGDAAPVQLNHTFNYFGRQYSQLYFSMNGFVSFQSISIDSYDSGLNRDIIAPLWADVDTYNKGRMFYSQVRSGPFISLATQQVNQMFPGQNFTASWVFVGTWVDVEFEYYAGDVNIQVVLVSDKAGRTFALLNYGDLPAYSNPWMAGYKTLDNTYNFIIQVPGTTSLSSTSNVGTPGRWAFRVDGNALPSTFYPILPDAVEIHLYNDGDAAPVQLNRTFNYFGRQFSQLYLSMNGFVSFEYLVVEGYDQNLMKDIIAPLWVDIDLYNKGKMFYSQVTSGPLIKLATEQVNQMFPGLSFTASWVFICTWLEVEFEFHPGNVTFQVVLVSDDRGRSFALMNFGDIPAYTYAWLTGYKTQDSTQSFVVPVQSITALTSTSNVGIPGCWALRVDMVSVPFSLLYPMLPGTIPNVTSDGSATLIKLDHPFLYFGRQYSQLFVSMDGFLSFVTLGPDTYVPSVNQDIIAPLWTDLDTSTSSNISFEKATSGPLTDLATNDINQMFPGLNFSASWVFVCTWEKMEFEPDVGEVTFQVVLISGNMNRSFILMNYGDLPSTPNPQTWMAGYRTVDDAHSFSIPVESTADLSSTTNVGIPGRWALRVDGAVSASPPLFYPFGSGAGDTVNPQSDDGSSPAISLQNPFSYFRRSYSQLYVNNNGYLTFDQPSSSYIPSQFNANSGGDIIAPFWTDIDNRGTGVISYNQYTTGSVLSRATQDVKQHYPGVNFTASWVFVATWDKVGYYSYSGTETSFQVVLISGANFSFVLMNYGDIAPANYRAEAGYDTNMTDYYVSFWSNYTTSADLKYSSNVNVPGRWAFLVYQGLNSVSRDDAVAVRMKVMTRSNLTAASNQQILIQQFQDELRRRGVSSTVRVKVNRVRDP